MEFKNRYYHLDHFNCTSCKKGLQGEKVNQGKTKEGERGLFCPTCYSQKCHPMCKVCDKEIKGVFYEACGAYYHPYHFTCTICEIKLGSEYKKKNNLPYCEPCYNEKITEKCDICKKLVTDKRSIVGDKTFHFDCFRCFYCEELMGSEECVKEKGKYYHYQCYLDSEAFECHFCKDKIIGEYLKDK